MCANTFPRTSDTSKGYLRRLIIIDFKQMFVEPDKIKEGFNQKPMDPHLLEKLLKELPGIFNWAVEGLMRLLENNAFTPLEDSDQLMLEFAQANNHLYCFVDEELGRFSKKTHRTNIFTAYRNWADTFGINPLPANRFYSNLKSVLEALGYKVEQQGRFWTILGVLPKPPEQEDPEKKRVLQVCETNFSDMLHDVINMARKIKNNPEDDGVGLSDTMECTMVPYIDNIMQEVQKL